MAVTNDRLESFGIYKIALQLFDDFWEDSEILGQDYRGRELVKQRPAVWTRLPPTSKRDMGVVLPKSCPII